ncbi:MAG: cell division protein ZapA [Roseibium album]|uniref:Cell division protein ZapA n=1 Tax=Roseibium album TaxID=311410 RepID=A0A0M6Z426_9HYPH|nr:cell division protein ZapA [Roseibium album]MBG6142094.1 cell division protein ZapA [Labrenzia sp. EL_142]MBG6159579.1 cell division protein ZapA [Labrenzia sp. EL_162]MBG6164333.1 cell division protein ZapA [Labrenzia sp. EL_195]MBG6175768.1 cell division protein ZapA [Labrenzia sp. EL_132]MBG6198023.1 cell division protein ZapA [Labrenzia sp. EL_159]MBG6204534.1 cell division protein ZapA [Labrenzia sp. EL_13]MBG6208636.1 cell division protein ZapA [Labrenzia sp. EL_126]MBG6230471.1 ce
MTQITVTINGKSFRMACDDGEEDRLMGLADRFDGWISELKGSFGEIGDQRLTVMAGIMATDQLSELERKVKSLEQDLANAKQQQVAALDNMSQNEEELSRAVNTAAARIESLADGLTKSLRSQEPS